jgi:hypothetical protein
MARRDARWTDTPVIDPEQDKVQCLNQTHRETWRRLRGLLALSSDDHRDPWPDLLQRTEGTIDPHTTDWDRQVCTE